MKKNLSLFSQYALGTFFVILVLEGFSLWGFLVPAGRPILFWSILGLTFLAGLKNPRIPWLLLWAELWIGSKGYLFYLSLFGFSVSIRLGIFLVAFACLAIAGIQKKIRWSAPKNLTRAWGIALFFVVIGVLNGWLKDYPLQNIFLDANNYLYLGFFILTFTLPWERKDFTPLAGVTLGAAGAMMFKTFALLFIFSHRMIPWMTTLYPWVRKTGIAEVTAVFGNFYRIFFQSHFYALIFFLAAISLLTVFVSRLPKKDSLCSLRKQKEFIWAGGAGVVGLSVILLSYSRSFWLALAITALLFLIGILKVRPSIWLILRLAVVSGGIILLSLGWLLLVMNLPVGNLGGAGVSATQLISKRTTVKEEPAASSRYNLLPPLTRKVLEAPIVGSGFGTTVTYQSHDARVLAKNPSGQYTTFAFEWGYLDTITEMGALGLGALLFFVGLILRQAIFRLRQSMTLHGQSIFLAVILGITVLLFTHATTPYLNHPLGIGFLMTAALIVYRYDEPSQKTLDHRRDVE